MGLIFRKGMNLGGGFRINLSKSGVGYSFGVPGYRKTFSSNGTTRTTHSIPGSGISYVETLGTDNNTNNDLKYDEDTKLITGKTEYYENNNISDMGKEDELIIQINKIRNINIISNICLISIFLIPIGIILKLLIAYKWKIELFYEMDSINKNKNDSLNKFFSKISENKKIWQISSSTEVYNTKYNSGADNNVERSDITISNKMPWYISNNIVNYCLNLKKQKVYFMPDRMIILKKMGKVGGVKYKDMSAKFSFVNFVETDGVPKDAEIINYTWKYVNKSGGPDKRFSDNKEIPICKYGEINLKTDNGINICIQCSNYKLIQEIENEYNKFNNYCKELNSL